MIDENTLMSFSRLFADRRHLEKDYLVNLLLKMISVNKISNELEFKGGTALYMFHGLDRFSEDLDFTYIGKNRKIGEQIDSFMDPVIWDFSLSYGISKNKGNVMVRDDHGDVSGIRTELFAEGPLFGSTGMRHKIKIDISMRNDTIMKPEAAKMVSRYGDIGTILVYKMPIEEILSEKLCAIVERIKARDLYDAYFMLKYKEAQYDEKIVAEKFRKRDEFFSRKVLLDRIGGITEAAWKEELSYLVKNLPDLGGVKKLVKGTINS